MNSRSRLLTGGLLFALLCVVPVSAGAAGDKDKKPRFKISKETTFVTEPLDEDGFVDYAAALNRRLSKGVTPKDNANVLLWRALGPKPEGTPMPADLYKWLGIDRLPEKGDYFIDIVPYMKKHAEVDPTKNPEDVFKDLDKTGLPWQTKDFPHLAGWLTVNEKSLDLVAQAVRRPAYFNPLVAPAGAKGPALVAAILPSVQKCRALAQALVSRAMLHLGEKRYDQAWQDLLTVHRLARLIARGGSMIEALVGVAVEHMAANAELTFLEHGKRDAAKVKACLRDLETLPPMPPIADKMDLAERFMMLEIMTTLSRGGLAAVDGVFPHLPIPKEMLPADFMEKLDWNVVLRNANQLYDRFGDAMREKDYLARQKRLASLAREVKDLKASLDRPESLTKLLESGPAARGKLVADFILTLLLPAIEKVQQAHDRGDQIERNLRVAFALAAYQRDAGAYPKTLDALAPKYLAKVPADLFSGKAIIYRPAATGYLLYSVGPNQMDEGGRWYDDLPPGDDPRVRMPRATAK